MRRFLALAAAEPERIRIVGAIHESPALHVDEGEKICPGIACSARRDRSKTSYGCWRSEGPGLWRELRGADLDFVTWLKQYEGLIDVSEVVKVGTKIAFVSGPLMGMEAQVLKVNKSRRQVQISVGGEGNMFHTIWCAIEYIQDNMDLELLHKQAQTVD